MEKIKIRFDDKVAETLLIPLWMRARESKRKDALLHDETSERLVDSIDYDFEKFSADTKSQVGVALRSRYLDRVVEGFVNSYENPVVVFGGCGLDPRVNRVKSDKQYIAYELDLPEVIAYRKELLPATENDRHLSASLFDTEWMKRLAHDHEEAQFLFVVEGVLMYFEESIVRKFMCDISHYFPGSMLYLERMGSFMAQGTKYHSSVRNTKATFSWGCDNPEEITSWAPKIKLKEEYYFMKDAPARVGLAGLIAKYFMWRMCGIWGFHI